MIYEKRKIGPNDLRRFEVYLRQEERSAATLEKYIRDVRGFIEHIGFKELSKQSVLDYKAMLGSSYAVASANSMIAAINGFIRFCGWHDFCVKQFKVQRTIYCSEEKTVPRGICPSAGCSQPKEKSETESQDPNDLRHGHPRQRACLYHRRSGTAR